MILQDLIMPIKLTVSPSYFSFTIFYIDVTQSFFLS